jgi:gamma-glutamyltranspeptidase/glutathione hydrolase
MTVREAALISFAAAVMVGSLAMLRRRARRRVFREQVKWVSALRRRVEHARPFTCAPATAAIPRFVRSPALALDGMVASSQPLATQAGLEILRMGGNAVDAAIAVAAALAVCEPCSNGIGGDFFMLAYANSSASIASFNGSGRSPAGLTLNRARRDCRLSRDAPTLPPTHAHTVTVPGAVSSWFEVVDALGSGVVSMSTILARAVELAERGFPVSPVTAAYWAEGVPLLRRASPDGCELLTAGGAPREGTLFRRPQLAAVLRAIAEGGPGEFYTGEIAEAIVDAVKGAGGCMSLSDLASHRGTFTEAISVDYWGVRVWEHPPNGGGLTALLALNILRVLEEQGRIPPWPRRRRVAPWEDHEPDAEPAGAGPAEELSLECELALVHAQIEALRLAYADTAFYVGDPHAQQVPVRELLSQSYAERRAALFRPERALADVPRGAPREESCTVSWQVVDPAGNAVSAVQSNYLGFGTGIVPAACGFTLQNRGLNFSTLDGVPNQLGPSIRPFHTILPCLLTSCEDGALVSSLTNMGGFMQPQGHVQLVCRLVRRGICPQEAVDLPRFCILPLFPGTAPCAPEVAIEAGFGAALLDGFLSLGHKLKVVDGAERTVVGRAQVIMRSSDGVLWGGSDGRADGLAAGLQCM